MGHNVFFTVWCIGGLASMRVYSLLQTYGIFLLYNYMGSVVLCFDNGGSAIGIALQWLHFTVLSGRYRFTVCCKLVEFVFHFTYFSGLLSIVTTVITVGD